MYTLGINAAYHDSAACLVESGRVLAAAEEERFTRIKNGKRPVPFSTHELPFHAIDYCLREAGIRLEDIQHVAYSFDPWLLVKNARAGGVMAVQSESSSDPKVVEWESAWGPLFMASIVNAPQHLTAEIPHHLQERLRCTQSPAPFRWHFVEHHTAHAASAFYPSPFERAAVLTLDGRVSARAPVRAWAKVTD